MPFPSIDAAKDAKFPTSADGITLTLPQLNKLAELYDAIKESGNADEPFAVAWTQWKKIYRKDDDHWLAAEFMGAEVPANYYDAKTHIVRAIKVGTIAHNRYGVPFTATKEWLGDHAKDWTGGHLIANHYGLHSKPHADIERSWFDGEFALMQLANMHPDTERRMLAGEHTGFSFDAGVDPADPDLVHGTNLSILFYPHNPSCKPHEGCDLVIAEADPQSLPQEGRDPVVIEPDLVVAESDTQSSLQEGTVPDPVVAEIDPHSQKNGDLVVAETDPKSQSASQKDGDPAVSQSQVDKSRGVFMPGEKTLTDKEIEALKAEAAEVATLRAEVKRLEGEVSALDTTIEAKDVEIEKQTGVMGEMYTAEAVETKVTEAKGTMFSAEDVETAKKEAVDAALVLEAERVDRIASELASITKMFPDGLDDTFRTDIIAMVKEGDSHGALVKLGEIEYTSLKASVHTTSTDPNQTTEGEIGAEVGGVGVYDPLTNSFKAVGE